MLAGFCRAALVDHAHIACAYLWPPEHPNEKTSPWPPSASRNYSIGP